jgi:energy-coupling factor transporter ATP-binding protein EcfA2
VRRLFNVPEFPLIGLARERDRLIEALRRRQPLLLLGPAGSGKSALIRAAVAALPASQGILRLRYSSNLHRLLIELARGLLETGHCSLRRALRAENAETWVSRQTSVHLKGVLWSTLEAEPRAIILDGVDRASFPMYRFLQRLYFAKGMGFVAAAREPAGLGALGRLFWDPRITVQVRPLNEPDAARLFDLAAESFYLHNLNVREFREKALDAAGGNPGQIIEMCRMATNPAYVSGRHIKFAPLRIDMVMKFL